MAEFEAPTFSLGFDFGFDSEPQPTVREESITCDRDPEATSNGSFRTIEEDDDDEEFGPQVADSDPEIGSEAPRILKRLRRGVRAPSASESMRELPEVCNNGDDDIEDFSSQEDLRRDEPSSRERPSMCSSSKFPLQGYRVLSTQTTSQLKVRKRKQVSNDPASASLGTSIDKLEFPQLTISPLRRFQLLDSDSDDLFCDENVSRGSKFESSSKENKPNPGQHTSASAERRTKASMNMPQNKDLWKDLSPMKSLRIPTPALDEVCEEYFRSVKEKNVAQTTGSDMLNINKGCCENKYSSPKIEQHWNAADPLPPAYCYFFHNDSRIQQLVRSRLSNFSPLGVVNQRTNIPGASVIDYMSQFGHGEASKNQATQNSNVGRTSTNSRKRSKKSNTEETSQASGSWVNPKSRLSIPKDAGRRRVHADGHFASQSAGHWFTGPDGRRVYVTKSGQELTGRIAYRHYRKESGTRFRKSKKTTRSKKK